MFGLTKYHDDVFNNFEVGPFKKLVRNNGMKMDLVEKKDSYNAVFDIPGAKKEEVKLSFEDNTMTISVETNQEVSEDKEEESVVYHYQERRSGSTSRKIVFPENTDIEKTTAKFEHGTLTVIIPKAEKKNTTRSISIN